MAQSVKIQTIFKSEGCHVILQNGKEIGLIVRSVPKSWRAYVYGARTPGQCVGRGQSLAAARQSAIDWLARVCVRCGCGPCACPSPYGLITSGAVAGNVGLAETTLDTDTIAACGGVLIDRRNESCEAVYGPAQAKPDFKECEGGCGKFSFDLGSDQTMCHDCQTREFRAALASQPSPRADAWAALDVPQLLGLIDGTPRQCLHCGGPFLATDRVQGHCPICAPLACPGCDTVGGCYCCPHCTAETGVAGPCRQPLTPSPESWPAAWSPASHASAGYHRGMMGQYCDVPDCSHPDHVAPYQFYCQNPHCTNAAHGPVRVTFWDESIPDRPALYDAVPHSWPAHITVLLSARDSLAECIAAYDGLRFGTAPASRLFLPEFSTAGPRYRIRRLHAARYGHEYDVIDTQTGLAEHAACDFAHALGLAQSLNYWSGTQEGQPMAHR